MWLTLTLSLLVSSRSETIEVAGGTVGCYYDFNNDRYIDYAAFRGKEVTIATWNQKNQKFSVWGSFTATKNVTQIVPGNFGGDEFDLLLIENADDSTFSMEILAKIPGKKEFEQLQPKNSELPTKLASIKLNQDDPNVLLLDTRGDMKMDILFKSDGNEPTILQTPDSNVYTLLETYPTPSDRQSIQVLGMGWIDIDRDCKADLVFSMTSETSGTAFYYIRGGQTSEGQTYWSSSSNLKKININNENVASNSKTLDKFDLRSAIFADFTRDGAVDILIRHKTRLEFALLVLKVNNDHELCSKLNTVEMERYDLNVSDLGLQVSKYQWPSDNKVNAAFIVGDVDFDQTMEIIFLLKRDDGMEIDFANFDLKSKKLRAAKVIKNDAYFSWYEYSQVSLFHPDDLIQNYYYLVITGRKRKEYTQTETVAVKLNWRDESKQQMNSDHYYLSVCPLRSKKDTKVNPDKDKPYVDLFNGVTVKIYFHDDNGDAISLGGFVRYQTNSKTLLLPCSLIGLDKTNNYIEKLMIGYPLNEKKEYVYSQPGVPPKTLLYLFPDPGKKTDTWILESFLSPYITWYVLAIAVAVICCVLGGMLIYFDQKQRKASKKESEIDNPANRFLF